MKDMARMDWLCGCTASQWEQLNNLRLAKKRGHLRQLVDEMMEAKNEKLRDAPPATPELE